MGTHVNPWLIHVNVWQRPLQYYKVISLQLIILKKNFQARIPEWVAISYSRGSLNCSLPSLTVKVLLTIFAVVNLTDFMIGFSSSLSFKNID